MAERDRYGNYCGSFHGFLGFHLVYSVRLYFLDPCALRSDALDSARRFFHYVSAFDDVHQAIAQNCFGLKPVATNADTVIGLDAVVLEPINNLEAKGQVKFRGQIWSARSADESVTYAEGEIVRVLSIEGVKLICEKKN